MTLITRIFRKFIRGAKVVLGTGRGLGICWLPYLRRKPQKIYLLPKWLWTCLFGMPHKVGYPWFSFEAVEWLEKFLKKDMRVFEWGSGGSTVYYSQKADSVISVESSPEWYKNVSEALKKRNITNCLYLLKEPKASVAPNYPTTDSSYQGLDFEDYCRAIDGYPDGHFDLVSVDGLARPFCIKHALKKIKPGGFLLLDDSEQPRHVKGVAELAGLKRQDFTSPKFYIYRCHFVTIWQKQL